MSANRESLPRRFGPYLLTAFLGEDVLGRVYRARMAGPDAGFARVRIFEGPDISEDALLDAIQENGEIHSFLKNPAIARGVDLDAVDGTPFLAWSEESGRTLDELLRRARLQRQSVPYEHGLLVAEKIATALDHAYNTSLDGERTLHGLVWPGFVSISDDGEIRLTGFGLASGFLPSLGRPRFAREIAPYLAPEERRLARVDKNSDVYSVGVILFELLAGRLPNENDPLADIKTVLRDGAPMAPEPAEVLRMCLGPAEKRFQTSGELRRELGKLLFSGPYSPSTFNFAFFLHGLFAADIESENAARLREASLDLSLAGPAAAARARAIPAPPLPPAETPGILPTLARDRTPPRGTAIPPAPARRRAAPAAIGGALLVLAAVIGGGYVLLRRPSQQSSAVAPAVRASTPAAAVPTPVPSPPPQATGPTTAMTDAQFKEEVARRVAQELKRIEQDARRPPPQAPPVRPRTGEPAAGSAATAAPGKADATPASAPPARSEPASAPPPTLPPASTAVEPTAVPTPAPVAIAPAAAPTAAAPAPAPAAAAAAMETPPQISRIVKPIYPPFALRARIGGTVVLRVHVTEDGRAGEIEVVRGVAGGLTESAVNAVKNWRFEPARRGGVAVPGLITIPIPFEP